VIAAPGGSDSTVCPAFASSTAHDEIPPVQYVSGVEAVIPDAGGVGKPRWPRLVGRARARERRHGQVVQVGIDDPVRVPRHLVLGGVEQHRGGVSGHGRGEKR
jgi:hypothetical protein